MSACSTIYHGTIQSTITIKMTTIMLIKTFDDEVLSTSFLLLLSRGSGFALTGGFGSQAARRSRTW